MEYTSKGWQVDPTPSLETWPWPGGSGSATTRAGDATTVLRYLAHVYNAEVEPIKEPVLDDWSYNKRRITGGTSWSEHAAGTALDINATDHPYKTTAEQNFTAADLRAVERILGHLEGAVEWLRGWDPMHFQLAPDSGGRLARIAAKVRPDLARLLNPQAAGQGPPLPVEEEDMARVMRCTGRADALQDGPLFIGLSAEESKNLQASGLKLVWVTAGTWDALAAGKASGQPARA